MAAHAKQCPATTTVQPLLLQKAIERTGTDDIPGAYSSATQLWMVDGGPIIEACSSLAEITTKTAAQIERDDNTDPSLLELQTKTLSQTERDDQGYGISLLELSTKTDSNIERDD